MGALITISFEKAELACAMRLIEQQWYVITQLYIRIFGHECAMHVVVTLFTSHSFPSYCSYSKSFSSSLAASLIWSNCPEVPKSSFLQPRRSPRQFPLCYNDLPHPASQSCRPDNSSLSPSALCRHWWLPMAWGVVQCWVCHGCRGGWRRRFRGTVGLQNGCLSSCHSLSPPPRQFPLCYMLFCSFLFDYWSLELTCWFTPHW